MKHQESEYQPLQHGGNLEQAKAKYGECADGWLDMSTGISPWAWPIPHVDLGLWQHLPPPHQQAIDAARAFYNVNDKTVICCPGSQFAIRMIPHLTPMGTIAVPAVGYQEHGYSWQLSGHNLVFYRNANDLLDVLTDQRVDNVVVINPNNPTGELIDLNILSQAADLIDGNLIVDEAFLDSKQQPSATELSANNVVVLKSIGKFFGLAGLRVGFVISNSQLQESLKPFTTPWSIAGPSLELAALALMDCDWQNLQRQRIASTSKALRPLLDEIVLNYQLEAVSVNGLFNTFTGSKTSIDQLYEDLISIGVWPRLYNQQDPWQWLRLSLPANMSVFEKRVNNLNQQLKNNK